MEKAGVLVIGVSQDDVASHRSFRANERLNFPLIADTDGAVCTRFGACRDFKPGDFNLYQRVAFLVDADGKVSAVYNINGPPEQIHALVDRVR